MDVRLPAISCPRCRLANVHTNHERMSYRPVSEMTYLYLPPTISSGSPTRSSEHRTSSAPALSHPRTRLKHAILRRPSRLASCISHRRRQPPDGNCSPDHLLRPSCSSSSFPLILL